ncbi:MAG: hypothetical protein WD749_05500 [Phycisphaerales bacterium]
MRIGLTYDLRDDYLRLGYDEQQVAEFDREDTIVALEKAVRKLGHRPDRIGRVQSLLRRLADGERWDLVFNLAEGLSHTGIGREAQVPTILDLHGIPYTFSDPLVSSLTLHKGMCKRVVRDLGLPTPDFAIVEREADLRRIGLPFPLFAKPVAEGSSKGVFGNSVCRTRGELAAVCAALLARFRQSVLVETYLPGRELTVGIVGTGPGAEAIAAMEVHLLAKAEAGVYSYANKENWRVAVRYSLATGPVAREACALALAAWRGLGCRDAGRVDVRADAGGRLNFIEVNVLPGLLPGHSDLPILCGLKGMKYHDLIRRVIASASERISPRIEEVKPLPGRARAVSAGGAARGRSARRVR